MRIVVRELGPTTMAHDLSFSTKFGIHPRLLNGGLNIKELILMLNCTLVS